MPSALGNQRAYLTGVWCMGEENVLYAGLDNKTCVYPGATDVDAIRAMLRILRLRPLPIPLLQCQADDGQV